MNRWGHQRTTWALKDSKRTVTKPPNNLLIRLLLNYTAFSSELFGCIPHRWLTQRLTRSPECKMSLRRTEKQTAETQRGRRWRPTAQTHAWRHDSQTFRWRWTGRFKGLQLFAASWAFREWLELQRQKSEFLFCLCLSQSRTSRQPLSEFYWNSEVINTCWSKLINCWSRADSAQLKHSGCF